MLSRVHVQHSVSSATEKHYLMHHQMYDELACHVNHSMKGNMAQMKEEYLGNVLTWELIKNRSESMDFQTGLTNEANCNNKKRKLRTSNEYDEMNLEEECFPKKKKHHEPSRTFHFLHLYYIPQNLLVAEKYSTKYRTNSEQVYYFLISNKETFGQHDLMMDES